MAPTLFDDEPKPGDLIEIFRGTYKHWAIYIGGHEVVHLIPPTSPASDLGPIGDLLSLFDSNGATVRRQKISDVVGSSRFQINNLLDGEHRPREPHVIVRDACRMVGRELPYNAATYNCEHFVTELRYGEAESRQVQTAAAVVGDVAVAGVALAALGAALFSNINKDDNKRRHHK